MINFARGERPRIREEGRTLFGKLITTLATTTLCLSVSAGLTGLAVADDATPDLARGEQLFELCTQCHAPDGGGDPAALARWGEVEPPVPDET